MVITAEIGKQLADYVLVNVIKKSKYKIIHIDEVSDFLKKKLEEEYTSGLGVAVKNALKEHSGVDFFREGGYTNEQKYHYCTGNWFAVKGVYDNPVQAKDKRGWYAWQESDYIDWDNLD